MTIPPDLFSETESKMQKTLDSLKRDLDSIRTGRATPALVENVSVDYYGVPTPLQQLASISIPEARVILIEPWDKNSIKSVEKSVLQSDLGLMPNNDGNALRINIPILTEERRRTLVRLVGTKVEESRVSMRNVRRDMLEHIRSMERTKDLSKDLSKRAQSQLQNLTDLYIGQIDTVRNNKEKEANKF